MYQSLSGMMVLLVCTAIFGDVKAGEAISLTSQSDDKAAVAQVLDALHERASRADFEGYFALYHDDAVFLGTDRSEYWSIAEFKEYTRKRFATGSGWTYTPIERFVHVAGDAAWFEERLQHAKYGETRGTGVLLHSSSGWRITQYNLTLPIPNDLLDGVVADIDEFNTAQKP